MAVTELDLDAISISAGEMRGELDQVESALHAHYHALHGWREQMETARAFELSALATEMQAVEHARARAEKELAHARLHARDEGGVTRDEDADAELSALQLQLAALAERLAAAQQAHEDPNPKPNPNPYPKPEPNPTPHPNPYPNPNPNLAGARGQ